MKLIAVSLSNLTTMHEPKVFLTPQVKPKTVTKTSRDVGWGEGFASPGDSVIPRTRWASGSCDMRRREKKPHPMKEKKLE